MGYTHYWTQKKFLVKTQWNPLCEAVKKLIMANVREIPVDYESDEPNKRPEISRQMIRFNGRGDNGCETFVLMNVNKQHDEYCKTGREPYDVIVMATLMLASYYNPSFDWSSDGTDMDEFLPAFTLAKAVEPDLSQTGCRGGNMNINRQILDEWRVAQEMMELITND